MGFQFVLHATGLRLIRSAATWRRFRESGTALEMLPAAIRRRRRATRPYQDAGRTLFSRTTAQRISRSETTVGCGQRSPLVAGSDSTSLHLATNTPKQEQHDVPGTFRCADELLPSARTALGRLRAPEGQPWVAPPPNPEKVPEPPSDSRTSPSQVFTRRSRKSPAIENDPVRHPGRQHRLHRAALAQGAHDAAWQVAGLVSKRPATRGR